MDGKDTPEAGQGTKREDVEEFWLEHSKAATVEEMMLDSQSTVLDKLERPEILKLLGSVENGNVLELGAGIGRFTTELARTAKSVHALDFMKTFIDANKVATGKFSNVTHEVGCTPSVPSTRACA
mmetsp:Transcript_16640/g.46436  ORF Transcript_16640/g.46436 Transcript_16640/m.46436 type:complete len:125 (+) Transcript_16640:352-726(+)